MDRRDTLVRVDRVDRVDRADISGLMRRRRRLCLFLLSPPRGLKLNITIAHTIVAYRLMGSQAFTDIVAHGITLLPLCDHATVSALSCVNRACGDLFARFLQVNGLIDMRSHATCTSQNGTVLSGPLYFQDRFHGSFECPLTPIERCILIKGVRAWASKWRHCNDKVIMTMVKYSFGQLVLMQSAGVYCEFTTVAGVPVDISIVGIACTWVGVSIRLRHDEVNTPILTRTTESGQWADRVWSLHPIVYDEQDAKLVSRVRRADLHAILRPYEAMAVQLQQEYHRQMGK
jgi:hypothetical protein